VKYPVTRNNWSCGSDCTLLAYPDAVSKAITVNAGPLPPALRNEKQPLTCNLTQEPLLASSAGPVAEWKALQTISQQGKASAGGTALPGDVTNVSRFAERTLGHQTGLTRRYTT
jgi:hypothetical protein